MRVLVIPPTWRLNNLLLRGTAKAGTVPSCVYVFAVGHAACSSPNYLCKPFALCSQHTYSSSKIFCLGSSTRIMPCYMKLSSYCSPMIHVSLLWSKYCLLLHALLPAPRRDKTDSTKYPCILECRFQGTMIMVSLLSHFCHHYGASFSHKSESGAFSLVHFLLQGLDFSMAAAHHES